MKHPLPPNRKQKLRIFNNFYKTGQFIYSIGESKILRSKSRPVPITDITTAEFKEKLSYLKSCLRKYRKLTGLGRGIAAPLVAEVIRPSWIEFEYLDEKGESQLWNTKDETKQGQILNRVFEHEIDHLEGVINIDKVLSKTLTFDLSTKESKKAKFKRA